MAVVQDEICPLDYQAQKCLEEANGFCFCFFFYFSHQKARITDMTIYAKFIVSLEALVHPDRFIFIYIHADSHLMMARWAKNVFFVNALNMLYLTNRRIRIHNNHNLDTHGKLNQRYQNQILGLPSQKFPSFLSNQDGRYSSIFHCTILINPVDP